MRVIFVRHGESTGNVGIPSFDLSQMPLTALGQTQAQAVAASWMEAPSRIAMSPYLRAQQTAQPTVARYPAVPVDVLPMEEFAYLEPSRWNGTSREQRLPFIEAYWERGDPGYCDGPGAENFERLLGRVDDTLARLAYRPTDALVYAFSHGQFMQALRTVLLFPGWTPRQRMANFWPFNIQNPILNADKLEVHYRKGIWSTAPALQSAVT
nr:histidine phosphatase family protein [Rhodoferax sp.]